MKLLRIRFKNLNSLAGEWSIDFTDPAYLSDGIFAITGPTGAGKSTILDAICLALYGQTPRLGKITKSNNEIMARQTGECFAEVTFQTQKGRYRSLWSQRRARRRANGELQNPKQELINAKTNEVLEAKIRDANKQIEDVTGLNFDRFTRSILLAQGGFAAFLTAPASQRADILEQITGTELYSDISRYVHELHTAQQSKLKELEAGTKDNNLLEADEEAQLRQDLTTAREQETVLSQEHKTVQNALTWLNTVQKLQQDLTDLQAEAAKLEQTRTAFIPQAAALALAEKAARLDGAYAALRSLRKEQDNGQEELTKTAASLPALETTLHQHHEALTKANTLEKHAKTTQSEAAPLLKQVDRLDHIISDTQQVCLTSQTDLKKIQETIADSKEDLRKTREEQQKTQTMLDEAKAYLQEHEQDSHLAQLLPALKLRLDTLTSKKKELSAKTSHHQKLAETVTQTKAAITQQQADCDKARQAVEIADVALAKQKDALDDVLQGRTLDDYQEKKNGLLREEALLKRIQSLETERAHLEDGKACPLCGATEHPYAQGNIPPLSETEQKIAAITQLITQAKAQQAKLETLKTKRSEAETTFMDASTQSRLNNQRLESEQAQSLAAQQEVEKLHVEMEAQEQELHDHLKTLAVSTTDLTKPDQLLTALQQRLTSWQNHSDRKETLEKQLTQLTGAVQQHIAELALHKEQQDKQQGALTEQENKLANAQAERKALFGDKDPAKEEASLSQAVTTAEHNKEQAAQRYNEQQGLYNKAQTRCDTLKEQIANRTPQLEQQSHAFLSACQTAGLENEARYLAVSLPSADREALSAQARTLREQASNLTAKQQDRQARLKEEEARRPPNTSHDELTARDAQLVHELDQLKHNLGQHSYRLKQHDEAKERQRTQMERIEAQRKECRRWHDLHDLIGSSDGKKYRNFAQGLTFEIMISHANQQLKNMTDRYLLTRDAAEPLELNVIDNYQAGEIRSTKNLSGGESFLVSLTLALGMSQMASQSVQIDSLFLDEGFGTLDEDALDSALETLATLQEEGKLIGIISHVEALKERITTQIHVIPQAGGKSALSGPGIAHVA